jgi:glutathione S-transferase
MKKTPFELIKVNPLSGETRTAEYRKKFPLGMVPALEDTDNTPPFRLSEASAIMIYLCEKYKWDDFYPTHNNGSSVSAMQRRAKIHEYISHHNESTRVMTRKVMFPTNKWLFSPESNGGPPDIQGVKSSIRDVAKRFQHKFLIDAKNIALSEGGYIVDGEGPTIADLIAYPDLAQIPQVMGIEYSEWPELEPLMMWMDKMSKLPYHDDVHRTAYKMGEVYQSQLSKL